MNPPYTTILVDDEEPARIRLRQLLGGFSETFSIIGEAVNGDDAVALINSAKPQMVFLDIQMPGKNGFEVIESIAYMPYLIFCTAFDQYALKAFETNSIDYLVKPVTPERLEKTVAKLQHIGKAADSETVLRMVRDMLSTQKSEPLTSFPVKVGDRVVFVKIDEITNFEAKDKYVELNTTRGKQYTIDQSLNYLEEKLPPHFVRVHRSIVINTALIKEIRKYLGSNYSIVLDDNAQTRIVTGRAYVDVVKRLLAV